MRQIGCRVSDELFAAVELARGDVPRERWMRRVFEEATQMRGLAVMLAAHPDALPRLEGDS